MLMNGRLLVDDEFTGSLVPNQPCHLALLSLRFASAEGENFRGLPYTVTLQDTKSPPGNLAATSVDNYFWVIIHKNTITF